MQDKSGNERLWAGGFAPACVEDHPSSGISRLANALERHLARRVVGAQPNAMAANAITANGSATGEPRGINRLFFGRSAPDPMAMPHGSPMEDDADALLSGEHEGAAELALLTDAFEAIGQGHEALQGLVDLTCTGMFIFDTDAHLVFANRYGERMLEGSSELQVGGGKLSASRPDNMMRISQLFARLSGAQAPAVGMTRIERLGSSPYVMLLARCLLGCNEALVAFITDTEQRATVAGDMLRDLYGLGRAEAEIATALARGLDLDAIAEQRSTSVGTVRNQVKAIAAKMECTRQVDIVRKILSIPIICLPDEKGRA